MSVMFRRFSTRTFAVAALLAASTLTTSLSTISPAAAEPVVPVDTGIDAAIPAFYHPPTSIPTTPGTLIRTEPMTLTAALPEFDGSWPAQAQRVMYASKLQDGDATAVTGTFIDSSRPWHGNGERPTVVIGPGTMGQGDQCAASRAFPSALMIQTDPPSLSANQELFSAGTWNALGACVFVTDYIGLGTPGIHTYVNRIEEAHAMIDAARAANALSGTGAGTPLAFWGYSQGGGAAAAAAELQPSYAPELNLEGTWAGAPPADLRSVLEQIDGNLIGGVVGFNINGLLARYPELDASLDKRITPEGRAVLDQLSTECVGDIIIKHPFLRTDALTVDGRPLLDHLDEIPEAAAVLDEQRIGNLTPTSPVLITSGINDDTIPYRQARRLAEDWCAGGATVTFRTNHLPPVAPGTTFVNHFGPEIIDGLGPNGAFEYLTDRFNGLPVSGCQFD
ncbi:lipase [Rhodococcus sp. SRB_17]|nr:lipase [Rhodococcus sp. SRB_17]